MLFKLLQKYFPSICQKINRYTSSPVKARLAHGAYWGALAATAPRVITIFASFLLAHILGQSTFGEYGVINSTVSMVSAFSGLGLGATVVKYLAELKFSDPDRAGRILALSTIVNWISALLYALAFVLLGPWLASKTLAAPHLAPLLQLSAISLAMGTVNSIQQNVLTGLESFRISALITILTSTVQSVLLVFAAWMWQLTGVILALAIGSVITAIIYFNVIGNERHKYNIYLIWNEAKDEWRVLIKFSLPAFLGGILVGPAFWGANAILANQQNGYAELGILNAANQWQQVIQLIPGILGAALLPVMAEKFGNGDKLGSYNIMKKMMGIYAIIVVPAALILSLFSPLIMRGYGQSFETGNITLVIIVFTSALLAIMTPVGQFIAASGKIWPGFLMNFGWAVCMLIGSFMLAKWGAKGIAGARFIAYLIHAIWTFGFVIFLQTRFRDKH